MPYLKTNYRRKYTNRTAVIQPNRVYMGPIDFSINAYTDGSGIAVVSVLTVLSQYNAMPNGDSISGFKLFPIDVRPLSFSNISYSGANMDRGGNDTWSLMMNVTSMYTSGSFLCFEPSFSGVVIAGSAAAVCRILAVVCSGPGS